ncbi:nucleoside 2-deoxyribosyltransferase [Bacillus paramobilis]|uniref:nucleoside 2-deoxyribosyltransferase n=1 Tax=Bacillus paramobilis TaxID=2817477 RepID=UPI003D258E01
MNFYVASGFQNKHLVRSIANELNHAGWHHTYDWTRNKRAVNQDQLREIGQAEKNAIKKSDVFLLILDGGNGSHTEFGMAIALEKKIYVYHERNLLQTTFYHLPEINIFEGDATEFASYVMDHVK